MSNNLSGLYKNVTYHKSFLYLNIFGKCLSIVNSESKIISQHCDEATFFSKVVVNVMKMFVYSSITLTFVCFNIPKEI